MSRGVTTRTHNLARIANHLNLQYANHRTSECWLGSLDGLDDRWLRSRVEHESYRRVSRSIGLRTAQDKRTLHGFGQVLPAQ